MFADTLTAKFRKWAARLVFGALLTCTGCTATGELAWRHPRESSEAVLTPLVKTSRTNQGAEVEESASAPILLTSSWRKRRTEAGTEEKPGVVVHASAERTVTEVTAYEPALMGPLPVLPAELAEPKPRKRPVAIPLAPMPSQTDEQSAPATERTDAPAEIDNPKPMGKKSTESQNEQKKQEGEKQKENAESPDDKQKKAETDETPPEFLPSELTAGPMIALEEVERLALTGNPALLQAGEAIEKAHGYFLQLGLKPNPQVGYTASEVFNEGHGGQQGVYLNQTFVRGHKQKLDQEVLCQEIGRLKSEYRAQEARVLTDVRQQYYQVLGNQRRVELLKKLEESVLAAANGLKKLVDAGEIPEVDYIQINLLASELQLKRENAEIELTAGRNQLAALMGKPDMNIGELAGDLNAEAPPADLDTMFSQLLANSPQIQAATGRIARAQAMIQRQERQNVPNLLAQGALMQDTSTNNTIMNLQLGFDLPYRNRNQGNIAAAVADYRRAVEQRRQLELALRSQLAQTLGQLRQAENSVRMYDKTIVPQAEQNLTKVTTAYEAGELDLTRLFVAQQGNVEVSLQMIAAQVNQRQLQALVDGALLSGGLLNEVDTEMDASLRGATLEGQ